MARIESGKYVPNKGVKVSQLTIDSMKREGMKRALERANSGSESAEYVEGARRMYGSRVTGTPKKIGGPKMSQKNDAAVYGEAKAPTVSNNYKPGRKEA